MQQIDLLQSVYYKEKRLQVDHFLCWLSSDCGSWMSSSLGDSQVDHGRSLIHNKKGPLQLVP